MLKADEMPASCRLSATDRREEIWSLLVSNQHMTLRKMAEIFSVSKNTILADMDFLTMIHPLRADVGKNGGYRIDIDDPNDLSCLYAKHVELLIHLA